MVGAQKRLKEVFAKSIPSVVRFMEIAPLVVVTSPIIYAGTGLRVKRRDSISFVSHQNHRRFLRGKV